MTDPSTGDPLPGQPPKPEPSPNEVLRNIGRELERQTVVLQGVKTYLGFIVLVIVVQIVVAVLIVAGVITLEFKPQSTGF